MSWNTEIKGLLARAADNLGILDAWASIRGVFISSQIVILKYHKVCPKEDSLYLEPITPESFEGQIKYLLSQDYKIISLDDVVKHIQSNIPLPKKVAVLTFDDGHRDNYLNVYPIIKRYRSL